MFGNDDHHSVYLQWSCYILNSVRFSKNFSLPNLQKFEHKVISTNGNIYIADRVHGGKTTARKTLPLKNE